MMIRWIGLAVLALVAAAPGAAHGQVYYVAPPPVVSYYSAPAVSYYSAPAVSYYSAPAVSYYSAPAVSYYSAPAVSYYSAPAVSYYAGPSYYAPTTVSTYRYGLFGRNSVTTVGYGVPSYAPVYRSYYAPAYRSYYVPIYP